MTPYGVHVCVPSTELGSPWALHGTNPPMDSRFNTDTGQNVQKEFIGQLGPRFCSSPKLVKIRSARSTVFCNSPEKCQNFPEGSTLDLLNSAVAGRRKRNHERTLFGKLNYNRCHVQTGLKLSRKIYICRVFNGYFDDIFTE